MKKRRMDKVARMERARARAVRRKVLGALKWAAVGAAAWAVSAALHRRAAGGLSWFDAGAVFVSLVALWTILEALARELAGAARERMRTRTRERVRERRSRRGSPFKEPTPRRRGQGGTKVGRQGVIENLDPSVSLRLTAPFMKVKEGR